MRVFENRVPRGIFGVKRDEVKRSGENYTIRSLIFCIPQTANVVMINI